MTKVVTKNLNKVIDVNFYPIKEAENSNMRHRPIGIGVQGLADAFAKMRLPFESQGKLASHIIYHHTPCLYQYPYLYYYLGAMRTNKHIFETMYYAAVEASSELAEKEGKYSTYEGSPMSKGKLAELI